MPSRIRFCEVQFKAYIQRCLEGKVIPSPCRRLDLGMWDSRSEHGRLRGLDKPKASEQSPEGFSDCDDSLSTVGEVVGAADIPPQRLLSFLNYYLPRCFAFHFAQRAR